MCSLVSGKDGPLDPPMPVRIQLGRYVVATFLVTRVLHTDLLCRSHNYAQSFGILRTLFS